MAQAKRQKSPNGDLVAVVRIHKDRILRLFDKVEHKRPVILLDLQRMKIHAFPCEKCKSMLRTGSHVMLDDAYKRAITKNKVLVLVWDKSARRLVTTTLRHD